MELNCQKFKRNNTEIHSNQKSLQTTFGFSKRKVCWVSSWYNCCFGSVLRVLVVGGEDDSLDVELWNILFLFSCIEDLELLALSPFCLTSVPWFVTCSWSWDGDNVLLMERCEEWSLALEIIVVAWVENWDVL